MELFKSSSKFSKKQIILLSIPVFFSNIAIPLVGMIDTGLMGNLNETKYLVATSIATSVMTMIIWSFGFLRMGTVGIVAQAYGKSDYREIVKTLLRNFLIALIVAFVIIILIPIIKISISYFFSPSDETEVLINEYLNIRVFSVPAELIMYIMIGFYLGIQKTKISSFLIITLSSLNIILSSIFVLIYDLKVAGVALGTLIASYITMGLFLFYTYKYIIKKFKIIPKFENIMIKSKFLKLLNINFDIFVRTAFLTFAFLWITYLGSKIGEDYVAVNSILLQFIILAAFFLDAYAYSTEGIVGYTIGKRSKKSFLLAIKNSFQLSFFTALIIVILYIFFFKDIVDVITSIELLRYISYKHFFWIIIIPPVASFCYQLDGIFIGASQTRELRNAMIFSVLAFIIISINLSKIYGNQGIWLSLFLFMILRSITLKFYFKNITKKI
tara:strand:- start:1245 stop:2570 length:1326 start_codon:yes stop_codon:yes gene_type:complete